MAPVNALHELLELARQEAGRASAWPWQTAPAPSHQDPRAGAPESASARPPDQEDLPPDEALLDRIRELCTAGADADAQRLAQTVDGSGLRLQALLLVTRRWPAPGWPELLELAAAQRTPQARALAYRLIVQRGLELGGECSAELARVEQESAAIPESWERDAAWGEAAVLHAVAGQPDRAWALAAGCLLAGIRRRAYRRSAAVLLAHPTAAKVARALWRHAATTPPGTTRDEFCHGCALAAAERQHLELAWLFAWAIEQEQLRNALLMAQGWPDCWPSVDPGHLVTPHGLHWLGRLPAGEATTELAATRFLELARRPETTELRLLPLLCRRCLVELPDFRELWGLEARRMAAQEARSLLCSTHEYRVGGGPDPREV